MPGAWAQRLPFGPREQALLSAQHQAESLFAQVIAEGLVRSGITESALSDEIAALARERFGVRRHWHKRVVRTGPNTLLGYYDEPPERTIAADDVVYVDFGPVFGEHESDYGRSYALGQDLRKQQLCRDIETAFAHGRARFLGDPELTAGGLYDYVVSLAVDAGWEFGALTAGHPIGEFPHERDSADPKRLQIRSGNTLRLRDPDQQGRIRHWILEIHFVDRAQGYGGFHEALLTIGDDDAAASSG